MRVGDGFYFTGTTMRAMPGLPVLHKGGPKEAFWCFDKEIACATHNYLADQLGKKPLLLSVTDGRMLIENGCSEPAPPQFISDEDGVAVGWTLCG